ncbi:hypothetical protein FA95DRAFT_1412840 [Auriscalpium vulgare]|uniref:Uncharacterized protein n=1 Tax=Auriscalpium vulgare TaxID=40419 RepID=A0ACB8RQK1_9AGAM|nr:hypothetical protein FA95DRAFT_1412840 [Auriscalpium vulgare]
MSPGSLSPMFPGSLSDFDFIGANLTRMGAILDLHTDDSHKLRALCTPAPLLRTLKLRISHRNGQASFLPDGLLGGSEGLLGGSEGLPELRHLSVVTWDALSFASLRLPQLVSVDISYFGLAMPTPVRVSTFAALGRMPALERLALRFWPEDAARVPVTLLPALQHLSLVMNSVSSARRLLAHLGLPAGVRIFYDSGYTDKLPTFFATMNACFVARPAPIVRVDIKLAAPNRKFPEDERDVEVGAWRSGDTDGAPALMVRLRGWEHVAGVLRSLASTHLEAVAVGGDAPDAAWLDALRIAPGIHRVTVKGGLVPPFCAALERAPGVLPALSTLVINVHAHPFAKTILQDTLPRLLTARASAGISLRELAVVGYDEDEACMHVLREAVPGLVVRWCWEAEPEDEDEDEDEDSENIIDSDFGPMDLDFSSSEDEE